MKKMISYLDLSKSYTTLLAKHLVRHIYHLIIIIFVKSTNGVENDSLEDLMDEFDNMSMMESVYDV